MNAVLETYWPLLLGAALLGLLMAWWVYHASRRTRVTGAHRDVLDEGAAPAARNAALIDAPPAARTDAGVPLAPAAAPAPASVPDTGEAAVATDPAAGDLHRLKGVGPKLIALLAENGVTRLEDVAAWDDAAIDRIDARLGRFQGRIRRDDWPGQARLLLAGDDSAYAARYGAPG